MAENCTEENKEFDIFEFRTTEVRNTAFTLPTYYDIKEHLGSGSYGAVCAAIDLRDGKEVAIKRISDVFTAYEGFQKRILREIKLLKHFQHENILSLLTLIPPVTEEEFEDVYIVTQRMDGDLSNLIESGMSQITDDHVQYFMYQILCGVHALHSANVLHRDLKPENIFITVDCKAKIGDFGLSRGLRFRSAEDHANHSTATLASLWYRPPELLLGSHIANHGIDIWAAGCILYELLTGDSLFQGSNPKHQLNVIVATLGNPSLEALEYLTEGRRHVVFRDSQPRPLSELLPPSVNPLAVDLLTQMLQFDPRLRPTALEALRHPYLSNFHTAAAETAYRNFDFTFETRIGECTIRELILEEIVDFNPDFYEGGGEGHVVDDEPFDPERTSDLDEGPEAEDYEGGGDEGGDVEEEENQSGFRVAPRRYANEYNQKRPTPRKSSGQDWYELDQEEDEEEEDGEGNVNGEENAGEGAEDGAAGGETNSATKILSRPPSLRLKGLRRGMSGLKTQDFGKFENDDYDSNEPNYDDEDSDDDCTYEYTPNSSAPPSGRATPLFSPASVDDDWFEIARQLEAERNKKEVESRLTFVRGE